MGIFIKRFIKDNGVKIYAAISNSNYSTFKTPLTPLLLFDRDFKLQEIQSVNNITKNIVVPGFG